MIEANLITTKPGIYCFKNTVNGKHYIGQAINLLKRFKTHMHNFASQRYDTPLYRAFTKYTLDNFEYCILEIVEETLGGDYGILGYKFTLEQKEKLRENTLKITQDGRYEIIVFNLDTNEYRTFLNMRIAADTMGFKESSFRTAKCRKRCYLGKFYIASTVEEILEILKNKNKKETKKYSKKGSETLYKEYWEYLSKFDKVSIKQIEIDLGISKSTIMKRNQKLRQLGYDLKMIRK